MQMPTVSKPPFLQTFKRLKWLSCITRDWKGQGWLSPGLQILSRHPGRNQEGSRVCIWIASLPLVFLVTENQNKKKINEYIFRVPHNKLPLSRFICIMISEVDSMKTNGIISFRVSAWVLYACCISGPWGFLTPCKLELSFPRLSETHTHRRSSLLHHKTHPLQQSPSAQRNDCAHSYPTPRHRHFSIWDPGIICAQSTISLSGHFRCGCLCFLGLLSLWPSLSRDFLLSIRAVQGMPSFPFFKVSAFQFYPYSLLRFLPHSQITCSSDTIRLAFPTLQPTVGTVNATRRTCTEERAPLTESLAQE